MGDQPRAGRLAILEDVRVHQELSACVTGAGGPRNLPFKRVRCASCASSSLSRPAVISAELPMLYQEPEEERRPPTEPLTANEPFLDQPKRHRRQRWCCECVVCKLALLVVTQESIWLHRVGLGCVVFQGFNCTICHSRGLPAARGTSRQVIPSGSRPLRPPYTVVNNSMFDIVCICASAGNFELRNLSLIFIVRNQTASDRCLTCLTC